MAISENNAKVFPVEISINASGTVVKPGMTAAVNIMGESRLHVLIVPIGAVFADDKNQDIVYLMPKAGKAIAKAEDKKEKALPVTGIATPVQLGANDFQMVEVTSGLKEGDRISLSEPVKPVNMNMMMN
jgi:multidrug efflux pump subunit AcrA (membrane-fusion protein)